MHERIQRNQDTKSDFKESLYIVDYKKKLQDHRSTGLRNFKFFLIK